MNINDAFPSKYLKAADIKGSPPISVVIRQVVMEDIGADDKAEKPVIYFEGKDKGVVLNKTNGNMIAHTYGPETEGWLGKPILLRCEAVPFKGQVVDSIRVAVAQAAAYEQAQRDSAQTSEPDDFGPTEDFDDSIPF